MICEHCGKQSVNVLYCDGCGHRRYKAKLRIVHQNGQDHALYLFPQEYIIGRDPEAEICFDDASVSRRHARLGYDRGSFFVEDLGSKNGVIVNGARLKKKELENFDCIQIGTNVLHFYFPDSEYPEEKAHLQTGMLVQETLLKLTRAMQDPRAYEEALGTFAEALMAVADAVMLVLFLPDKKGAWRAAVCRQTRTVRGDGKRQKWAAQIARQVREINASLAFDHKGNRLSFDSINDLAGREPAWLGLILRSQNPAGGAPKSDSVFGIVVLQLLPSPQILDGMRTLLLDTLLNQAVVLLENRILHSEALAKRRLDRELEVARSIQKALLPPEVASIPHTEVAAYSRPCSVVGGDFYDFVPISEHELVISVGDISGKGMGAALLMSGVQGGLRSVLQYERRPEEVVQHLNELIHRTAPGNLFATLVLGIYDFERGTLRYVNAGHNPPLVIRRSGEVLQLKSSATALGILQENRGAEAELQLQPGDFALFYTDGLTETMNADMRPLGLEPLERAARAAAKAGVAAAEMRRLLLELAENHAANAPPHDDLTLIVLKRLPAT